MDTSTSTPPRFLTGSELLALLRMNSKEPRCALHRLRKKGLRGIRCGNSYVYDVREVERFTEQLAQQA